MVTRTVLEGRRASGGTKETIPAWRWSDEFVWNFYASLYLYYYSKFVCDADIYRFEHIKYKNKVSTENTIHWIRSLKAPVFMSHYNFFNANSSNSCLPLETCICFLRKKGKTHRCGSSCCHADAVLSGPELLKRVF